jgi:hypothetical protein
MSQVVQEGSTGQHFNDPIKEATLAALNKVLEPLLALMLDAGVTVQEFNKIVRERAVRAATHRVFRETGRESKSRVAILTGLPRSEVTKLLNSRDSVAGIRPSQHPARRVLAAWYDNPHFSAPSGEPAILPIFGKRKSFQRLVDRYGAGIPVRAMLDELTQMDALERLPDQKVRVKARVPILTGVSSRSITAVGDRGRDLLATLTHNLKHSSQPLFEATALTDEGDPEMLALIRRELTEQGTNFINGATSLLNRTQKKRASKPAQSSKHVRLGVTVYYFQDETPTDNIDPPKNMASRRKNLRRQERKSKKSEMGHA